MLRSILFAALIAGTLTGILFTGIQHLQVIPLIIKAESYEGGGHVQQHNHGSAEQAGIEHGSVEQTNDNATERHLFTLLANILAGISFSLLLAGAIILSRHTGWRKGLLWGIAGYLCFFAAPALGLKPTLPGTLSAPLDYRQAWWIATVAATAIGLGLLVFAEHILLKALGLIFIAMPHVVGAPLPQQTYSLAPEQLRHDYITASAMANAAFWIILGSMSGYLLRKTENTSQSHAG